MNDNRDERIKLLCGGLVAIAAGIMPGRDPNNPEDIRAEAEDILARDERLEAGLEHQTSPFQVDVKVVWEEPPDERGFNAKPIEIEIPVRDKP